ncbi:Protein NLP6 [Camellia lanceoleosa]|uniref:Protein NLP6 n=1 Tax=Camellia lanceoleosa TaxID=1840588 RepID=A0ACC0G8C9_9ERIC|nr:Protein NLP6 [Camellia lanceoleosa]
MPGDVGSLCEAVALAKPNDLEYIPLGPFLPPKSPKMVSILSYLSIVKISRKISIRLLQVLPLVQLPQTLQIVIVEEKMTQLLTCSREFISQDCSLVEERSVEITVEVDATNNGAHGVKAYENFPIVSHSEKKNARDKFKRNYKSISVLTLEDLQQHFGKREDVAKSFGVVSTLKRICRQHGISRWPFQLERQKERLMEAISPSMHEKHDSSLRCIRTPLHARSSPRTMAVLDGGEMVQLDSSKQQSLVAFDITNNSAHLVRASQSCSTISHLDETNSRETLKRKCITKSVLSFEDLQQHFSCKLDDAAKALDVSKMDCILFEPEGEKNVSPTCKTPTVGIDFIEGPNLSNTENHSNEESITTPTFLDFIPVFEKDCILLEPQGEKNVSPTHNTPTNGQTEVGNEMVGHIQDQNGIVPEFIEGPNLSNTENRSNEKSLTSHNFQDSIPGNYLAMDFSISSTYTESGEARGFSELAFQPKELTPSMAYPNPNAFVFTQPHISLREMLIENVGSSRDSRNFPTSAIS